MKIKTTFDILEDNLDSYAYTLDRNTDLHKKWVSVDDIYNKLNELTKGTKINVGELLDIMAELKKGQ